MPDIAAKLDLELAYKRTKFYRSDRGFVQHPYIYQWIEEDLSKWLEQIQINLNNGYQPNESSLCFVPKPNGLLRKSRILDLSDEIVYTAIVGAMYPKIYELVQWSQGRIDMSYQLMHDATKKGMDAK